MKLTERNITTQDVWEHIDNESQRIELQKEQFSGELAQLRLQAQREQLDRLIEQVEEWEER